MHLFNINNKSMPHTMTHIYNPVASGQQEPMPAQDSQPEQAKTPRRRIAVAIAGTLLTIIAWVLLFFSGTACIACAAIAVAVCAFGVKGRLHNLAVTALIASSVLILVYLIFEGIIHILLNSL